jgi:hypothetical protein
MLFRVFELEKCWTDYAEISFGHYYDFWVNNLENNILLSVFNPSFLSFSLTFFCHFVFSLFDISLFYFNKIIYFAFQSCFLLSELFINVKYLCNVRVLDHFWTPVVACYATEDAGQIVNLFLFTISHVHNYHHNYLLRFCAFTQLQSLHANIPFYSLTVFITHLTSSHIHTSRVCLLSRTHSSNWLLKNTLKLTLYRRWPSGYVCMYV